MPVLKVNDVDMLKQILVKEFDCFSDRPVSARICVSCELLSSKHL